MITANTFEDDQSLLKEIGAEAYIRKPFKEYDIFENIGKCLNVRYQYENVLAAENNKTIKLCQQDLAILPDELINRMLEAAINAQLDVLLELIETSTEISPQVTSQLKEIVTRFEYDTLIKLLRKG